MKYQQIGKFPSIAFDISVVIDLENEVGEVEETIHLAAPELISDVKLFDIYQGEHLEAGKKATAFSITLQAQDRTLTDQDLSAVQAKIFANLEKIGGQIRGR